MTENPNPNPADDQPEDDSISDAEFARLMKDPKFATRLHAMAVRVEAGEFGQVSPELLAMARGLIARHKEQRAVMVARDKLQAVMAVMQRPGGSMDADERLAVVNRALDEATDVFLDLPEPYRTGFLNQLLPLRDELRRMESPEA